MFTHKLTKAGYTGVKSDSKLDTNQIQERNRQMLQDIKEVLESADCGYTWGDSPNGRGVGWGD